MNEEEAKNLTKLNQARVAAKTALQAATPAGQAKLAKDAIKGAVSLHKYIDWGNDWPYLVALFIAVLKDLLDFAIIGSLPVIGTAISLCCSIFIFFMMLLVGGSKKGKAAKSILKSPIGRYLMLGAGTLMEMIFGLNFFPAQTATVIIAYLLLLMQRKESGG